MPKKPLFRTKPRLANIEETQEANKAQGRSGSEAFLDPEEALERAMRATSLTGEHLVSLALHPHEPVALALIRNSNLMNVKWAHSEALLEVLLWRALRDAKTEGVAWTPLLDALVNRSNWSQDDREISQLAGFPPLPGQIRKMKGYTRETDAFLKLLGKGEVVLGKRNWIKHILPRVKKAPLAERLKVKEFESDYIRIFTGRMTRDEEWSEKLAEEWTDMAGKLGAEILRDKDKAPEVKQGVINHFTKIIRKHYIVDYSLSQAVSDLGYLYQEPLWSAVLTTIKEGGSYTSGELWRIVARNIKGRTDQQWAELRSGFETIAKRGSIFMGDVFGDPRLTLEDVLIILDHNRSSGLRRILAHSPAINIPGVAERIAKSKNLRTIQTLGAKAAPETYGRVFKKMAKNNPEVAWDSLERRHEEVGEHLKPKDLAPFLENKDKNQRLEVIKMVGKVGKQKNNPKGLRS